MKTVRRLHQLYGEPKEKGVIPDAEFASHFTPETTQRVQIMRAELENIVDKTVAPYALLTHELPYSFSQFTVALNQLSLITTLLLFPDLVGLNGKYLHVFIHIYVHIYYNSPKLVIYIHSKNINKILHSIQTLKIFADTATFWPCLDEC